MKLLILVISMAFIQCEQDDFSYFEVMTEFFQSQMAEDEPRINYDCIIGGQPISGFPENDPEFQKNTAGISYSLYTKQGTQFGEDLDTPILIWLQGGPGSASEFGSFVEFGPLLLNENEKLTHNPYALNKKYHLMFIDNPVNVGFSYATKDGKEYLPETTEEAARHFVYFLTNLMKYDEVFRKSRWYITGESFAGHYIPVFTKAVLDDEFLSGKNGDWGVFQLWGIAIGDGQVSIEKQIQDYGVYLQSISTIDIKTKEAYDEDMKIGVDAIQNKQYEQGTDSFQYLLDDFINRNNEQISIYNYEYNGKFLDSKTDQYVKFVEDNIYRFIPVWLLSRIKKYRSVNDDLFIKMYADISVSKIPFMEAVLNQQYKPNFRVIQFQGQLDIIVNTPGNILYKGIERLINSYTNWKGLQQYQRALKSTYKNGEDLYGNFKCNVNKISEVDDTLLTQFCYYVIYGAGHMSPIDQPEAFAMLMDRFTSGEHVK